MKQLWNNQLHFEKFACNSCEFTVKWIHLVYITSHGHNMKSAIIGNDLVSSPASWKKCFLKVLMNLRHGFEFMTSSQERQLPKTFGSHNPIQIIFETPVKVNIYLSNVLCTPNHSYIPHITIILIWHIMMWCTLTLGKLWIVFPILNC